MPFEISLGIKRRGIELNYASKIYIYRIRKAGFSQSKSSRKLVDDSLHARDPVEGDRMRNGGYKGDGIPSMQGEYSLTKRPTDNSPSAATSLSSSYCASYTLYAFVVTWRGVGRIGEPSCVICNSSIKDGSGRKRMPGIHTSADTDFLRNRVCSRLLAVAPTGNAAFPLQPPA